MSASPTTTKPARHGAKFSDPILDVIYAEFSSWVFSHRDQLWLDPMGGIGKLSAQWPERKIITGELEMPWLTQAPGRRVQQDVHHLPYRNASIRVVCTSPTYGNRFADHHNARDGSRRNGYAFWLREVGAEPHENNSGLLKFGPKYKLFHILAYREIRRVLKPGGMFVLNVSDFIANKRVVPAVDWHVKTCLALGFELVKRVDVETQRHRDGANHEARVESEAVLIWQKCA